VYKSIRYDDIDLADIIWLIEIQTSLDWRLEISEMRSLLVVLDFIVTRKGRDGSFSVDYYTSTLSSVCEL